MKEQLLKTKYQKKLTSTDIVFFDFEYKNVCGFLIYVDSISDRENIGRLVLDPLSELTEGKNPQEIAKGIFNANTQVEKNEDVVIEKILDGFTALFINGDENAILVDLKKFEVRAVAEPPTSNVVRGPREGFNESVRTNLSLIRRRIKNPNLCIESQTVGRQSKTSICICYLKNIADDNIINEVTKRVKKIDIDNIPDSSYISKLIVDNRSSLFKQVGNTEKPDIFCAKLMEGRIGIIVDGSPIALTVPYLFWEDFQDSEDYYKSDYKANTDRILRVCSVLAAVLLPAIFVAAQLYHLEFIPLDFLLTIVNSVKAIPLSPSYEMFFTLIIFEVLNEASVRMPKYVGMALSVVGALVLGETAVSAGIVSSPTVLIMALSGICLYTVPELVDTMSLLRFLFLLMAGSFGAYGILIGMALLVAYLSSLENMGVSFLSPYSPLSIKDLKDGMVMDYVRNMKKRPVALKNHKNKTRIASYDD